ncbi:MAG: CO dehydrogenase/acetyl-CoA synthase subunit delta [Armatimonadota bacterium]
MVTTAPAQLFHMKEDQLMALEDPIEKWSASVAAVRIGATASEGGTRGSVVTIGGGATLPFMHFEGATPHRPVVAMEVLDVAPAEWPDALTAQFADVLGDPAAWAAKCVQEYGAEMIALRLVGTHPDSGDRSPDQAAETVQAVLKAVDVPLIIWGCDVDEKDNLVMPVCSQAARGERCLMGTVKEDNYKTLTASCMADGHALITESPLDINIAKQVNIMVSEMGFPLDRVVMFPTTGGLGYGIEYAYSIQERGRQAALGGDKMMTPPVICLIGEEAWRGKEAKATTEEAPLWGPAELRGPMWEAMTAITLLQAGSDLLIMRHPNAVALVKRTIDALMQKTLA